LSAAHTVVVAVSATIAQAARTAIPIIFLVM
jgi:hypothetical protein